ncbi:MAG: hypothetical protein DRO14_05455 [Thermoprotei archaeon]|nr:MAG: hypothetical protein DRO14_05455 [Thermoprotei archaeon]
MGSYVTISVKVRRELREEAERLGIKISEVLRRALEEEVKRRKLEELKKRLEKVSEALDKIDVERFVRHIREDREGR